LGEKTGLEKRRRRGDLNGDGRADNLDIDPFVTLLTGG